MPVKERPVWRVKQVELNNNKLSVSVGKYDVPEGIILPAFFVLYLRYHKFASCNKDYLNHFKYYKTMKVEIINKDLVIDIYGYSGTAINKDYAGMAFRLMDKMWQTIKAKELKHKGINIWVYEPNEKVFAGVELVDTPNQDTGMEHKTLLLSHYAYYKHIGPYSLIKQAGQNMRDYLKEKSLETCLPYIEIYGHWTNDESKLETELLMSLK